MRKKPFKIYVSADFAKKEILKRWSDTDLRKKVSDYLKNAIPIEFEDGPYAVSTVHIASPNFFFCNFIKKSEAMDLKPLVFEYLSDIFITTNFDKVNLAKMLFYKDNTVVNSKHIINLDGTEERKKIRDIKTKWGEDFPGFHHRILSNAIPETNIKLIDGSDWYKNNGEHAKVYYKYIMAFFVCHGVLFENFLLNERERDFTENIIIPAITEISKHFGIRPLIVRNVPTEVQTNRYWWGYDESIQDFI